MTNSISFDRAASFYDQTRDLPEPVKRIGIPAILDHVKPHGRILDVGTGTGRISVPMMGLGADVTGIDLSLRMMTRLRAKNSAARLAQADAIRLPFASHTFDAVLTTHVLHLIGAWREALVEFKRVITAGGVLLTAWQHHLDRSAGQALHEYWRSRVEAHGGHWQRPGAQGPSEFSEALQQLASSYEEVELLRYTTTGIPRTELDEIAGRINSDSWAVPDAICEIALKETRDWSAREYGDLDQPYTVEACFMLHVTHFE